MDLGFEREQFDVVFAIEKFPEFCRAYKHSREKMGMPLLRFGCNEADVSNIDRAMLSQRMRTVRAAGHLVGFIGGPPCPDFSNAGKHRGESGESGWLAGEYFDLIRDVEPDLVHTHSSKAGALGRRAAQSAGCSAVVHTPHTYSFLFGEMFGPLKRWLFKAIERRLSKMARLVVAVSEGEAETMRSSGVVSPDKVRVVSNGIDPGPYEGAAPSLPADSEEGALRVLVCGLLNVAKGQDLAISSLTHPGCEEVEAQACAPPVPCPGKRPPAEPHASITGAAPGARHGE